MKAIGNGIVCTKKTIGAQCDDRNSCTVNDRCTAALTCAGTPYSCDDGDACTADACDGAGGCNRLRCGSQSGAVERSQSGPRGLALRVTIPIICSAAADA